MATTPITAFTAIDGAGSGDYAGPATTWIATGLMNGATGTITITTAGSFLIIFGSLVDPGLADVPIASVLLECDYTIVADTTWDFQPNFADTHVSGSGSASGHLSKELIATGSTWTAPIDLATLLAAQYAWGPFTVGAGSVALTIANFTITVSTDGGEDSLPPPEPDEVLTPPGTFTYREAAPAVLAITPTSGPVAGGTAVTITGREFATGATVTIGGGAASSVVVVTAETITAVTPAHAAALVDVVVTNADATTDTLPASFSYQAAPPTYRSSVGLRTENAAGQITQTIGQPKTFRFTATTKPEGESLVTFEAGGVTLFEGTVVGITERTEGHPRIQAWDTDAVDFTHRLARRHPVGTWTETSATTILGALVGAYAPGFSASGVAASLPAVTVTYDGTADLWAAIVDVCAKAGAQVVLVGTTLYAWAGATSTLGSLTAVTSSNPDLLHESAGGPVTIAYDYTGILNRVTVRGKGDAVATAEDPTSIMAYGVAETVVNAQTLETAAQCLRRAEQELVGNTQPLRVVRYATRDLQTHVGKTVAIALAKPAINNTYLVQTVTIDQLDLVPLGHRPRFQVTAVPPITPVRRAPDAIGTTEADVVDLKNKRDPELAIEDGSIPASKLAGCIPGSALTLSPPTAGGDPTTKDYVDTSIADAIAALKAASWVQI